MRERVREFLRAVHDAGPSGVSADSLAKELGTSTRSLRSWANEAREEIGPAATLTLLRGFYRIQVHNQAEFEDLVSPKHRLGWSAIPQEHGERVSYLIKELVSSNEWFTVEQLAATLFVSERTVSKDLAEVERRLARYRLSLERRPHYGIRVAGGEHRRRACLAEVVRGEFSLTGEGRLPDDIHAPKDYLDIVADAVGRAAETRGVTLDPQAERNLVIGITTSLRRVWERSYVQLSSRDLGALQRLPEYPIAQDIALAIERRLAIAFPEEEVAVIAYQLLVARGRLTDGEGLPASYYESDEATGAVPTYRFDLRDHDEGAQAAVMELVIDWPYDRIPELSDLRDLLS